MKTKCTTLMAGILLLLSSAKMQAQTHYRVNATYSMSYDGGQYQPVGDSIHFYFSGNRSLAEMNMNRNPLGMDLPQYYLNQINLETALPLYPEARPVVSFSSDSTVYYGLNADETAFEERNEAIKATFDANNNINEIIYRKKSGSSWENTVRENYTYNANHQITDFVAQSWSSGSWSNTTKEVANYDIDGNIVEFSSFGWSSGSWVPSTNYLYQYDAAGNCKTSIYREDDGGTWKNYSKTTIAYNTNSQPTEYVFEEWDGSAWQQNNKATVSYNSNGDILEIISYDKEGSSWVAYFKESYTYTGTQKSNCIQQEFDGSVWNKTIKTVYNYDGSGLLSHIILQLWDDPTSDWANGLRYSITYNNHQLISDLLEESWNSGDFWEKTTGSQKILFFYESYGNTGISHLENEAQLNIYPNPTANNLNVTIDWEKPTSSEITIYDITGRSRYTQAFAKAMQTQQQIDISHLPAGSYYLNIRTDNSMMSKTFQVVK